MSEVQEPVQTQPTLPLGVEIITPSGNIFSDEVWGATPSQVQQPAVQQPAKQEPATQTTTEQATTTVENEEIVDDLEYLTKQTGYKSWEEVNASRKELEELRAKANTPFERKFANEESRKLAEAWEAGEMDKVFDYLQRHRTLSGTEKMSAEDAIKLHLKEQNPHYKPEDIQDIFEERYTLPKKPIQQMGEEDDAFKERMDEYNTRVGKVTRAIERDGHAAKQSLAAMIQELKPPEIPKQQLVSQGPSKEELEGRQAYLDAYVKSIPQGLEAFNGFSATFKDETVELPVEYHVSPEEKQAFAGQLQKFAESNLDANSLFETRWVNKDGSINIKQVAEDLYLLNNRDKIFQKIANESGVKRLNHQRKLNSNINVDGKVIQMPAVTEMDQQQKQIDFLWKNG